MVSFFLSNLTPFRNMFVNILNTSMLLSRGVFRGGAMGAHPPPGSVKYMLFGGFWPPPPRKKKKCKPSLEKKPEYASLKSLKLCLVLNHSKIYQNGHKIEEIYLNLKTGPFVLDLVFHSLSFRFTLKT